MAGRIPTARSCRAARTTAICDRAGRSGSWAKPCARRWTATRTDCGCRTTRAGPLLDHGGIWLLELGKFAAVHRGSDAIDSELTRWLKFFTEGERLDPAALPDWMQTPEMRHAMSTLTAFSDKEREYHTYQARMNYLRQQRSIQRRALVINPPKTECVTWL